MSTPDPAVPSNGPIDPPDSYGAPEMADFAASTETQPFPQGEPEAEAPTGTYELDPSEPYEPYAVTEDAPTATFAPPAPPAPAPAPYAAPAPAPAPATYAAPAYQAPAAPPVVVPTPAPATQAPAVDSTAQAGAYSAPYGTYAPSGGYPPPAQGQYPPPQGQYPPAQGYAQPGAYQAPYGYAAPVDPYAKSRVVAGLLGILLGGLGVHRFYLGYIGIGIAQIVVTIVTFGAGALWGFIEGILYLTQKTGTYSVDATGRPLRD